MKLVRSIAAALLVASGVASANVYVPGKAPLTLGADTARGEAIKQALINASYRKNAYVSAITEMENLEIKESASVIKTATIIKDYEVVSESECGMFYCVELKVQYGDKPEITDDIDGNSLFFRFGTKGGVTESMATVTEGLEIKLLKLVNGFEGISIVDDFSLSDYSVMINFMPSKAEKGLLSFFSEDEVDVSAYVRVANRVDSVSETVKLSESMPFSSDSESLYENSQELKSLVLSLIKQLPSENTFVVTNLEGNKIFLKSTEQTVGSYYKVIFEDLNGGDDVAFSGVVKSVYLDDVIIELQEVPSPSFRLKRLTKITK